ncbi:multi antimicrobial extrusion protein MatE [Lysobacter pythonis]|uniref:Multi antimicrobial extrusion protein MatE n=2 Tax=Solilutibacter pythonis TaxID=2483112 RepID=A0A3M2HYU1_9GAMM|nr:multi antimicrobial extrusion protein MatE [Lysobacter pythonis]
MTPSPTIRGSAFWRGFAALLLAFVVAQLSLQVDVAMLARHAPGMSGAYVLFTRLVLIDWVAAMAFGAVVSVAIAQAARHGSASLVIRWAMGLAGLIGIVLLLTGWLLYPALAPWVAGGDEALVAMLESAIPWFVAGAPFRILNACAAFALHATHRGTTILRWKVCEVAAKVAMNIVFLNIIEAGFVGCFMASLLVQAASSGWVLMCLRKQTGGFPLLPPKRWGCEQAIKGAWEGQRILSMQLLGLITVGLFAWPGISMVTTERLDAFGAGVALAMLVFSPLAALSRFLAIRFSGRPDCEVQALMRELLSHGIPMIAMVAVLLALGQHWLGLSVYAQQGPWWSIFVWSLALSLPVRLATNILRAALQGRGDFNNVAKADSLMGWILGLPLIAIGLKLDSPTLAYAYLWLPEISIFAWLTFRYRASARMRDAATGIAENS